ncbi:MAG: hypothetical protein B6U95_00340 [Thermofilum sp. ex4484_82]|nr:MAG: hypothetical protein B6U95_00340 [Thermofilum sp. ex4484_82]OYT40064.1 MAG: hypothetical protein B6U96_00345 [Archaeoglobales archaeon ex4484_92]
MKKIYCESPCGMKSGREGFEYKGFIFFPCCYHCPIKEKCNEACPNFQELKSFDRIVEECPVYRLIVEEKEGTLKVIEEKHGIRFSEI